MVLDPEMAAPTKGSRIHTFVPTDPKHTDAVRKLVPDGGTATLNSQVFVWGAGKTEVVNGRCHHYNAFLPASNIPLAETLNKLGVSHSWSYQYMGTDQHLPMGAPSAQVHRECKRWKGGWMWLEETSAGRRNIYWKVPEEALDGFVAFVAQI